MEKYIPSKWEANKAGVAILILDKIDLKIKKITRNKEGHYIMIKGSIQEGDITIVNIYAWRRQWHPTPVLLPGKSHGRKSLVGCSPWGRLESDTTERLHFHFSLSCIGEGIDNPLQCSCLENPWDRGAWWAAVYGVAQSQTQLK